MLESEKPKSGKRKTRAVARESKEEHSASAKQSTSLIKPLLIIS